MTIHLTGLPAIAVLLVICAVACVPIWLASLWLRDVLMRWVERRFRREMAALGTDPAQIDEDWRQIKERSTSRFKPGGAIPPPKPVQVDARDYPLITREEARRRFGSS